MNEWIDIVVSFDEPLLLPALPMRCYDANLRQRHFWGKLAEELYREQLASGGQDSTEARELCHATVLSEMARLAKLADQLDQNLWRVYGALGPEWDHGSTLR